MPQQLNYENINIATLMPQLMQLVDSYSHGNQQLNYENINIATPMPQLMQLVVSYPPTWQSRFNSVSGHAVFVMDKMS
jgi:hypothetical protein